MYDYDVIVIGAGHAGIEASLASARMACRTLLVTLNRNTIGKMSCNPAIGGVGKGQLVKEIDALGGQMARAADACAIQFRMLNASKGAAVRSSRAQIDMQMYERYMQGVVSRQDGLSIKEAEISQLVVCDGSVRGVKTSKNEEISACCVVICPGTFLDGLIHIGLRSFSGGRIAEPATHGISESLKKMNFKLLRFKTGTCPRLDKNTLDYSRLTVQEGDIIPAPFSFSTLEFTRKQVPCHIGHTNQKTHRIILDNLNRSPLYSGVIKSTGVRYCPSIEDKIVKFSGRQRHQLFLEPQGLDTEMVYPNGLSTSLPEDVQTEIIHSIEGLEEAKILSFGYGIEHTVAEPTQLTPSLETKSVRNLYFAGQINGTTGYEEAAAQGLVAGINAALRAKGGEPFILDRASSYIGVLIDDLTTKGTLEPYRMFTSRVEYRLILREDNADLRLCPAGHELGLVDEQTYAKTLSKRDAIASGIRRLKSIRIRPSADINDLLTGFGTPGIKKAQSLQELLKRPQVSLKALKDARLIELDIPEIALRQVEIEVKYSGFIERQLKDIESFKNLEKIKLPQDLDYAGIASLSREIREKLSRFKPVNLGQAARISGITPAAILLLMVYLRKVSHSSV